MMYVCEHFGIRSTVARKRPRSFCQKCRWQVTAKHSYTLRMWLCMEWHGAWLYGVHRTCAEKAAVSCGTSHASAVSTPLLWILKKKKKKRAIKSYSYSHSCRTTCERSESAQESGELRYISDHQNIHCFVIIIDVNRTKQVHFQQRCQLLQTLLALAFLCAISRTVSHQDNLLL